MGPRRITDKIHMPIEYNPDGSRKRFKYTNLEERKMLHFLANEMRAGNKEAGKKGLQIWKKYVNTTRVEKTPQGLESHFRKMMLPNLYLKCNEVVKEDFFLILRVFKVVLDKKKNRYIERSLNCSIVVDKSNIFQYAVFFEDGDRHTFPSGDGFETDMDELSTTCCCDKNKNDSEGSSGVEGSVVSSISLASEQNNLSKKPAANEAKSHRHNDVEAHYQNPPEVANNVNNETLTANSDVNNRQNISFNQFNQSRLITSSPVNVDQPNPLVTFFETTSSISGNGNNNEIENYQQISMEDFQSTQSTVVEEPMDTDANNNSDENSGSQLAENREPISVQSPNSIPEKKAKLIKKLSCDFPITSQAHKRLFLDRVVTAIRVYGGGDVDSSNIEVMNRSNAIFDGIVDDDEHLLHSATKKRVISGLQFLFQQPTTCGHGTASHSNSSSSRTKAAIGGDADHPSNSRAASAVSASSLPLRRSRRLRQRESSVSPANSMTATAKMKHRLDAIKKSPKSPH